VDTDGIFVSCTNLGTIEIIATLGRELNKPLVSGNIATAWKVRQVLQIEGQVQDHG